MAVRLPAALKWKESGVACVELLLVTATKGTASVQLVVAKMARSF